MAAITAKTSGNTTSAPKTPHAQNSYAWRWNFWHDRQSATQCLTANRQRKPPMSAATQSQPLDAKRAHRLRQRQFTDLQEIWEGTTRHAPPRDFVFHEALAL